MCTTRRPQGRQPSRVSTVRPTRSVVRRPHAHSRQMVNPSCFPAAPFTRAQALATGVTRKQLAVALANSVVRRVLHGVYVRNDVPDTIETRCRAAALVISPHSVVCDRTAAWLHGVDVLRFHELEILPPLETYVLRWHAPPRRAGCDGGSRDLQPQDVTELFGLRLTTPLRTVLDLACKLSARDALAVLDAFMRLHGITHAEMEMELPRYRGRRGVIQLRRLVPHADPRAESVGESWTRLAIIDSGLPTPEPQWWVEVEGVPTYRLDLAYPRHRVVIEYDGEEFHTGPDQRKHDRERREWLRNQGWIVVVVDKRSFTSRAIEEWLGELKQALRSRSRRSSRFQMFHAYSDIP